MLLEKMDNAYLTKTTAFCTLFTINLRYEIRQDLVINLIFYENLSFVIQTKV